ncbi:MAG: radical SAM protein, partial [Bacteroidales bacterium]|nr:radical SAM protein [Bacteroidales bacterium]
MDGSIIVTYRCPMHCKMCNIWDNPTKPSEEFKPELLRKLPKMRAVNITGGEPFVREDIAEIVEILVRQQTRQFLQHADAAHARIEYENRTVLGFLCFHPGL